MFWMLPRLSEEYKHIGHPYLPSGSSEVLQILFLIQGVYIWTDRVGTSDLDLRHRSRSTEARYPEENIREKGPN